MTLTLEDLNRGDCGIGPHTRALPADPPRGVSFLGFWACPENASIYAGLDSTNIGHLQQRVPFLVLAYIPRSQGLYTSGWYFEIDIGLTPKFKPYQRETMQCLCPEAYGIPESTKKSSGVEGFELKLWGRIV